MPTTVHHFKRHLLDKRVTIHLAGVGGNGTQMAACLARLDIAIRRLAIRLRGRSRTARVGLGII